MLTFHLAYDNERDSESFKAGLDIFVGESSALSSSNGSWKETNVKASATNIGETSSEAKMLFAVPIAGRFIQAVLNGGPPFEMRIYEVDVTRCGGTA